MFASMFQSVLLLIGSLFSLYAVWAALRPLPDTDPFTI
jgi:hypothetical protein